MSEQASDKVYKPRKWFGVRHVQAMMAFLGLAFAYSARTTMSIAIVSMTNPDSKHSFDWSIQRQSVILSSFSWGYILVQGFSGELAGRTGGMVLLLICVGGNALLSLLIPIAATYGGWITVCVCRGLQGLTQGTVYPTLHYLIAKWVPLDERGRLCSLILSGSQIGTAVQFIISGYIAEYWGWPTVFYSNGVVGLLWTAVYLLVGSDSPQVSKMISVEERFHIQSSLGQIGGHKRMKTPWRAIMTSLPYLSCLVANVGFGWGYWILFTEIPTYMSKALGVNIKSNGVMSALPYITMFLMNFPVGYASDYMLQKGWVTVSTCRKIFNSIAFFGSAVMLCLLTYIPAGSATMAVVFLCITFAFASGYYSGYVLVFLDIAPNFSSTIFAVSNWAANVAGLFAPLFAGFVLKDETSQADWQIIFYVTALVYAVSNVFFLLFGTAEVQAWNEGVEIKKKIKA